MSVNTKFKQLSNDDRWNFLKNGDFVLLEGTENHPIPLGLYRIFFIENQPEKFLIPMFDGPFDIGLFPYMATPPFPKITQTVSNVSINAEVY